MRLHGLGEPRRRGRPAADLRAGPVRRPLRPEPALEADPRPQGPDGRRAHLRPPRRPRPGAYKCGAVYGIRIEVAGISIYHQGSADLDDEALGSDPVDVFLAGVAGRSVTPATGTGSFPASTRGSSSRPTTTTSSTERSRSVFRASIRSPSPSRRHAKDHRPSCRPSTRRSPGRHPSTSGSSTRRHAHALHRLRSTRAG